MKSVKIRRKDANFLNCVLVWTSAGRGRHVAKVRGAALGFGNFDVLVKDGDPGCSILADGDRFPTYWADLKDALAAQGYEVYR